MMRFIEWQGDSPIHAVHHIHMVKHTDPGFWKFGN